MRDHRRTFLLPLVAGLALLLSCGDAMEPPDAAVQDRVVFVSTRAGAFHDSGEALVDAYLMNADGTGAVRLTEESALALRQLRLSPDGTAVAFYSDVSGCYDIWVMNSDGTGLTQLTGAEEYERCNSHPRWSPDGTRIAFLTSRNVGDGAGWDVYVMGADGANPHDVSANPSTDLEGANDYVYGWSPDGRVVLTSMRGGDLRTYLAAPDGSGAEPLFGDGRYQAPHWSPDGSQVVAILVEGETTTVHLGAADGTGWVDLTPVTGTPEATVWAVDPWSPDGSMVALLNEDGIVVLDVSGATPTRVSTRVADGVFLDWTSEGQILYWSQATGDGELYVMNADGTEAVNLTDAPESEEESTALWVPAWGGGR